jgi:hypothetical protein
MRKYQIVHDVSYIGITSSACAKRFIDMYCQRNPGHTLDIYDMCVSFADQYNYYMVDAWLSKHGKTINISDKENVSFIHYLVRSCNVDMLQHYIYHPHISTHQKDSSGHTIYDYRDALIQTHKDKYLRQHSLSNTLRDRQLMFQSMPKHVQKCFKILTLRRHKEHILRSMFAQKGYDQCYDMVNYILSYHHAY